MLIPLSDPIWSRLYGPYGVQGVHSTLDQLAQAWSTKLSDTLYWEMLFHQDTLYPVTYAALPWLWQMTRQRQPADTDALVFFSRVLLCASDSASPQGQYPGLSLEVGDHAKPWLPAEIRLQPDDMKTLAQLESWFHQNAEDIASACLDAVPADDAYAAMALCVGFCGLRGGISAATLLEMWADGHPLEDIEEEISLSTQDISALTDLWHRLNGRNPQVAKFIEEYANIPPVPSQQ